jgi:hypothetical protein
LRANRNELALHGLLLKKQQRATGPFPGLAALKSPWACLSSEESARPSMRLVLKYKTFGPRVGEYRNACEERGFVPVERAAYSAQSHKNSSASPPPPIIWSPSFPGDGRES